MARPSSLTSFRSEGGLLPGSLLERIARLDPALPGLSPESYHLARGDRFQEEINRSWLRLQATWAGFQDATADLRTDDPATGITRDRWLLVLFQELGFGRLQPARNVEVDGASFPISHEWSSVPIHLVGVGVKLDTRTPGVAGAARSSPHSLVQDLLNRSPERLWGVTSNGRVLRLLRDNLALTRQAYVEFDLEGMMAGENFADFTLLWLLAHQSRFEGDNPEGTWLERWSQEARVQGTRALEHLSDGVAAAIEALGAGFLRHAANAALRTSLESGKVRPKDLQRQLLRVVYRILFVLVAEERNRLLLPSATPQERQTYSRYYSMQRIRELAERRRGSRHTDLWCQIQVVVRILGGTVGCPDLALPALGGALFSEEGTADLNASRLANADLLRAMHALSGRNDERAGYRWRFDYRNLGADEFGGVYERLLELEADVNVPAATVTLNRTGVERHVTGSHYTPEPVLKRVLDFALEPAIQRARRAPDPVAALLDLRVLDPACGSGHFLIAAAHRIAQAVASERTGETSPAPEAVSAALREVVAGCVYGVDLNPQAVELCKVALWLDALDPGKPLSFLDHHIRVGNSLLGVPLATTVDRNRAVVEARRTYLQMRIAELEADLAQRSTASDPTVTKELAAARKELTAARYDSWADAIPTVAFRPAVDDDRAYAKKVAASNSKETSSSQMALGNILLTGLTPDVAAAHAAMTTPEESVAESVLRAEIFDGLQRREEVRHLHLLGDTWSAAWFWPLTPQETRPPTQALFSTLKSAPGALPTDVAARVADEASARRFFHFELEFPHVFLADRGGFDVVIGNPPYLGGMKISTNYGEKVLAFLKASAADVHTGGRVDLAAYFLRRGFDLLREGGDLCFITTNTIGEGDTRSAGLVPITSSWGGELVDVVRSQPWEGQATVSVTIAHVRRGAWEGPRTLDGAVIDAIGPDLGPANQHEPQELEANRGIAFAGTNILGKGFLLDADGRERLIRREPSAEAIVKPFFGGRDLMNLTDPSDARRWVIDFGRRSEKEAREFPEAMEQVERLVRPDREKKSDARAKKFWWQFGRPAAALTAAIAERRLTRVLAVPEVSKHMRPIWLPSEGTFQHTLVVFADDSDQLFGELASSIHWLWVAKRCRSMRTDPTYNPARAFVTFPRPAPTTDVVRAAAALESVRSSTCKARGVGATVAYNLVDDPESTDPDIMELRDLQRRLDRAAAAAYGWDDMEHLELGHHPTDRFGTRWMPEPGVQRDIEDRLLKLNRERSRR